MDEAVTTCSRCGGTLWEIRTPATDVFDTSTGRTFGEHGQGDVFVRCYSCKSIPRRQKQRLIVTLWGDAH